MASRSPIDAGPAPGELPPSSGAGAGGLGGGRTDASGGRGALITIVIPCFNERETILTVIERVMQLPLDKQVIVVDNCSTDGTRELLRSVCAPARRAESGVAPRQGAGAREVLRGEGFSVVLQARNECKGASVRLGIALARGEYFVCQDADLEYDPKDILRLLAHARATGAAAVFGSRLLTGARGQERGPAAFDSYQLGRIALTLVFRGLYPSALSDVATCYKLMRTDVARALALEASGFDLDFEIPAKLHLEGHAIHELPVAFAPRSVAQGKKIRWRDGLAALWVLFSLRLRRGGCRRSPGPFTRRWAGRRIASEVR